MANAPRVLILNSSGVLGAKMFSAIHQASLDGTFQFVCGGSAAQIPSYQSFTQEAQSAHIAQSTELPLSYTNEDALISQLSNFDVIVNCTDMSTYAIGATASHSIICALTKCSGRKLYFTPDWDVDHRATLFPDDVSNARASARKFADENTTKNVKVVSVYGGIPMEVFFDIYMQPRLEIRGDKKKFWYWEMLDECDHVSVALTHTNDLCNATAKLISIAWSDTTNQLIPDHIRLYSECNTIAQYMKAYEKVKGKRPLFDLRPLANFSVKHWHWLAHAHQDYTIPARRGTHLSMISAHELDYSYVNDRHLLDSQQWTTATAYLRSTDLKNLCKA